MAAILFYHSKTEHHSKTELFRPFEIRTRSVFEPPLYSGTDRESTIYECLLTKREVFLRGGVELSKRLQFVAHDDGSGLSRHVQASTHLRLKDVAPHGLRKHLEPKQGLGRN